MSQPTDWRSKPRPEELLPQTPEEELLALVQQAVWEAIQRRIRARIRLTRPAASPKGTPDQVLIGSADEETLPAGWCCSMWAGGCWRFCGNTRKENYDERP